ncbi:MAG: prephenate dehydratase [Candidatus Angelobacter sp. Gp1-AA117]|nr:MAG: prephenate dehydratase [Candidatus Angelobacter sp. Gp1-AA117]
MKVAIQGERGAFSHQAAMELAPKGQVLACARSIDVFDALDSGKANCAVIPVENTLAGQVGVHLDLMVEREVFILREMRLRIEHSLIAAPGVTLKELRQVLSHPVALDQCRNFFRQHAEIEPVAFYDTAGSVKHVMASCLSDTGAIASRQAAEEYGGQVLQTGLEDDKQNFTRFFLIQKKKKVHEGADKTSLVFSLRNVAGALFKALSVFALRDLDLSKIESRPVRGKPWEYMFFVDVLRGEDEAMEKALDHLAEIAGFVKVLGVYPRARAIAFQNSSSRRNR